MEDQNKRARFVVCETKSIDIVLSTDVLGVILGFIDRATYGTVMRLSKGMMLLCYKYLKFSREEWVELFKSVCKTNNVVAVKLLMEHKAMPHEIVLTLVSASSNAEIIDMVMKDKRTGPNDDERSANALMSLRIAACITRNMVLLDMSFKQKCKGLLDYDGRLLETASKYGHADIVGKLLILYPLYAPECLNSALLCACENEHVPVLDVLLASNKIDSSFFNECRVFMEARERGYVKSVKRLLLDERAYNPRMKMDAVYAAISSDHHMVVDVLCAHGGVRLEYLEDACRKGAKKSFVAMTKYYGKYCGQLPYNSLLVCACNGGFASMVRMLLDEYKADPSWYDHQSLDVACEKGFYKVASRLLKDPRVNPSFDNERALVTACRMGHANVVKLLLNDPRVDPTVLCCKPLFTACKNGNDYIVKMLLEDERVKCAVNPDRWARKAIKFGSGALLNWLTMYTKPDWVNENTLKGIREGRHEDLYKTMLSKRYLGLEPYYASEYKDCIKTGDIGSIRSLLRYTTPPKDSHTLIIYAITKYNMGLLDTLLKDARICPDKESWQIIYDECRRLARISSTYMDAIFMVMTDTRAQKFISGATIVTNM
jgi:ankyrin repeat protein